MEIPKPVAIAVIVLVAVAAIAAAWYFSSGGGATNEPAAHAYPKAQPDQPGVEAFGVQPPDNRAAPASSLPLETGGKR